MNCVWSQIFTGEGQARNHHFSCIIGPFPKKKVAPREKFRPSEEVEKGTKILDDIEEPAVTIRKNNLDNFQGQSTGSTGWLNLDCEWLK